MLVKTKENDNDKKTLKKKSKKRGSRNIYFPKKFDLYCYSFEFLIQF